MSLFLRGVARWILLFVGPSIIMLTVFLFGDKILYNGNLLFAIVLATYTIALTVYYPMIILWGIYRLIRNGMKKIRKKQSQALQSKQQLPR